MKSHSRNCRPRGTGEGLVLALLRGGRRAIRLGRAGQQPSAGLKEAGSVLLPARRAARICAQLRRLRPLIWLEGMLGTPGKEQFQLGVKEVWTGSTEMSNHRQGGEQHRSQQRTHRNLYQENLRRKRTACQFCAPGFT